MIVRIGPVYHAIELSPAYVGVAEERWQAFTGKEAVLQGSGQTFVVVKAERLAAASREA